MSRVESPFQAIAAQVLDDTPEIEPSANAVTATDARSQERDGLKEVTNSHTGQERNGSEQNRGAEDEAELETAVHQDQKASLGISSEGGADLVDTVTKKSKKRTNVWTKTTSRKSAKKSSVKNNGVRPLDIKDDNVLLKPFQQEDDASYPILLSKVYKAEKIELSADRLAASGSKGYRMVRATRGVVEGAWYFEIYVEKLGDTGHTRLGWSTRRGDIQAPVGYDAHSYAYRDVDGSKVHAALREKYGEAYYEKDVLGFYINIPREAGFTRKAEEVVGYKGQPYVIVADEALKPVPGSEIIFFKNGVCQGVAFQDICDGTYFPAASTYTHPSQDFCKVVFNFGPDFKYPATDLGDRPVPSPMCKASGPAETRAGVPTTTEVVVGPADTGGGKQRMAPDCGNAGKIEATITISKEENGLAHLGKAPILKKKDRIPNFQVGKPKIEESRLNPEVKRAVNLKGSKKETTVLGLDSTSLPSQKGGKKDITGPELSSFKSSQKVTTIPGVLSQKGIKKDMTGGASALSKISKKVLPGRVVPPVQVGKKDKSVTGLTSVKGSKKDKSMTGLTSIKGSKKDISGSGLSSVKVSRTDIPVTGLSNIQGSKRDMSNTGFLSSKQIKKNITGTPSALFKSSNKDLSGRGFVPMRSGSSAMMGRRGWEEGMHGAFDVDVVVVESSTFRMNEGAEKQ